MESALVAREDDPVWKKVVTTLRAEDIYDMSEKFDNRVSDYTGEDEEEALLSMYKEVDKCQNKVEVEKMCELIKRQDAINAVMQNYCYESDRMTALQELPVITDEKIRNEAIINYSVAVLAEVAERAKQEDAPIYEGDKEVDQWVRLSDVEDAINKYLN